MYTYALYYVNDKYSYMVREEIKHQRRVKFKIIEKKYFKRAQDLNLLTWDAKEQMRYLHNEYPDEWTVDRLAESFPVSFEGVIKVYLVAVHLTV